MLYSTVMCKKHLSKAHRSLLTMSSKEEQMNEELGGLRKFAAGEPCQGLLGSVPLRSC